MAIPAPATTAEAMSMVLIELSYMAAADPTALAARAQAECLHAFEQADAISTAGRARILAAFTTGQGYSEDAEHQARAGFCCDMAGANFLAPIIRARHDDH